MASAVTSCSDTHRRRVRAIEPIPPARHDGGQRQYPQQHRQRVSGGSGDKVAVARHHVIDDFRRLFPPASGHTPAAHVAGYHRVIIAFGSAMLLFLAFQTLAAP
ncbi:hypothetical protein KCP70_11260 [Salmonella enterica subsp. enterica]|nr:hypothetical protein KCP70_11260 [Salmonella enterica subsp. enterica]